MVRLSKIYTKTGDDGTTGLGDLSRVKKDAPRVAAYGTVDEANAAIGVCVAYIAMTKDMVPAAIPQLLTSIQNDMFDVGADLCCPIPADEKPGARLRVTAAQTERLERAIDQYNEPLKALTSFVLPGGTPLSAWLHVARTVTRRAERDAVTLLEREPKATNPEAIRYLNRLSDLLFVLGRVANNGGTGDVLWTPGKNRT